MRVAVLGAVVASATGAMLPWGVNVEVGQGVIVHPPDHSAMVPDDAACTTAIAGKLATADGAPALVYTADCKNCDFRLMRVPAMTHAEATREVIDDVLGYPRYVGDLRGPDYKVAPGRNKTLPRGEIPQVNYTYAYYDAVYGVMNEHGVGIGESTCMAKVVVGVNSTALLTIAELSRVALERCKTARCAIQMMGDLGVKYGFVEPSGEGGETLTVIDPQDAWVFHMMGTPDGKSAVWAAQRVPDDHIVAIGNYFTIGHVDTNDVDNFLASDNMHDVAASLGYWNPNDGPFHFSRAFAPENKAILYTARRVWRVFSIAAPSQAKLLTPNPKSDWDLPWSVKPDSPMPIRQIMRLIRDHYEGSDYDMTKGVAAGPWGTPTRAEFKMPAGYPSFERAISLYRTSYALALQSRPNMPAGVGGLTWFAPDAPHTSLFVPFYAAGTEVPESYKTGWQGEFSFDVAWWAFDFLSNYIDLKFQYMFPFLQEKQEALETEFIAKDRELVAKYQEVLERDGEEEAAQLLNKHTKRACETAVKAWWDLAKFLFVKFNDGYDNVPKIGGNIPYPTWWLDLINNRTGDGESTAGAFRKEVVPALGGFGAGVLGTLLAITVMARWQKRSGYTKIGDEQ